MGVKPYVAEWLKNNEGKLIHCNDLPGTTIYRFRDNVYSMLMRCPHHGGDSWSHLVIGLEKAMLIDTGFGIGDLKKMVDELTGGLPIIVVNTHAHHDHTLGNYQFDKVYIHKCDAPMLEHQMYPEFWSEANMPFINDMFFTEKDVISFKKYEIVPCEDGHIFDLGGGYKIELIWLPGHSSGECGLLDKKNRILFSGDAIMCPHATALCSPIKTYEKFPQYTTVSAFRNAIAKLEKRIPEFDCLYDGHGVLEASNDVVGNMLRVCDAVIDNPNNDYIFTIHGGRQIKTKFFGNASIQYVDARI